MLMRYLGAKVAVAVMTSLAMLWALAPAGVAAETPPVWTVQAAELSAGGQLLGDGASISAGASGAVTTQGTAPAGGQAGTPVSAAGAAVSASNASVSVSGAAAIKAANSVGADGTASLGLLGSLMDRIRGFFTALIRGAAEARAAAGADMGAAGSAEAAGSVKAGSNSHVQLATQGADLQGSASRPSAQSGASSSAAVETETSTAISVTQSGEGFGFLARIGAGLNHVLGSLGILGHAGAAADAHVGADAATGAQVQTAADAALTIAGD